MDKKRKKIFVTDFDGTITRNDFYDLICRQFPQILEAGHWGRYESGEISHFEALRRIFAEIRSDEMVLLEIIEKMEADPDLVENVARLKKQGWEIVVASAGSDWYIRKILKDVAADVTVHANPGKFFPDRGLLMELPHSSAFYSQEVGVDKVAVVEDALQRADQVVFAGDGRPDLPAALLVPPERRYARNWLAEKLTAIGEGFILFEKWSDVTEDLLKEGSSC
ncbi:MAG: MtnX-like HAD-IB family phosphatase [Candidatus Omnitrophota bacterium]